MPFTDLDSVCAHFPGFQRGSGQNPTDDQITAWITSHSARLSAIAIGRGFALDGLSGSNPDAYSILSLINELGAAADLGDALFSLLGPDSTAQGWAQPAGLRRSYESLLAELRTGSYDKLFDPTARTGDISPEFGGIAGQETDPLDPEENSNLAFRKNDCY